jgi:hypothetical protein
LLEEGLLASLGLFLVCSEVLWLRDLLNLLRLYTRDVDLVGCGDDVSGVDSSERDAVDLEGPGDEQDTLVEGLEEDDALASESAGQENQNGAGLQRLSWRPRADGLADLEITTLAVGADKSPCGEIPEFPPYSQAIASDHLEVHPV